MLQNIMEYRSWKGYKTRNPKKTTSKFIISKKKK